MNILLRQNKLPGRYMGSMLTGTDDGRLLKFFADQELWSDLLKRRDSRGQTKLWLKMGLTPVKFALSKPKSGENTPEGEASSQARTVAASEASVAASNLSATNQGAKESTSVPDDAEASSND